MTSTAFSNFCTARGLQPAERADHCMENDAQGTMALLPASLQSCVEVYTCVVKNDHALPMTVVYVCESSLGKSDVRRMLKHVPETLDVVFFMPLSTQAAMLCAEHGVQSVAPRNFSFDKSRTFLAPRYRVLSAPEVETLLKKRCLQSTQQLPKMLAADAMAVYFGFDVGSVVLAIDSNELRVVV